MVFGKYADWIGDDSQDLKRITWELEKQVGTLQTELRNKDKEIRELYGKIAALKDENYNLRLDRLELTETEREWS